MSAGQDLNVPLLANQAGDNETINDKITAWVAQENKLKNDALGEMNDRTQGTLLKNGIVFLPLLLKVMFLLVIVLNSVWFFTLVYETPLMIMGASMTSLWMIYLFIVWVRYVNTQTVMMNIVIGILFLVFIGMFTTIIIHHTQLIFQEEDEDKDKFESRNPLHMTIAKVSCLALLVILSIYLLTLPIREVQTNLQTYLNVIAPLRQVDLFSPPGVTPR